MFEIFDPVFEVIARLLAFYYSLQVPLIGHSYGVAIILLTLTVMAVLMPLTLKATRSTIAMQFVQPELKALQKKYKDDKQMLNQETMDLYKERGINPVGGCLPILAQLPVFLVLYRVFLGLTTRNGESAFFGIAEAARQSRGAEALDVTHFNPNWVPKDSEIYSDLVSSDDMRFGPFDLAAETRDIVQQNVFESIPYLLLILLVVAGSYYQQRQVSARRDGQAAAGNPMQQQLMRVMPLMSGIWGFIFPAALVLYWATSNMFRIAQQAYITRSFYRGEDSIGKKAATAQKELKDSSKTGEPKYDKGSGKTGSNNKKKTKSSGSSANRKAKMSDVSSNGSGGSQNRNQAWSEKRKQKTKAQKSRSNGSSQTSSRVTPKGTKSSPAPKKRKR